MDYREYEWQSEQGLTYCMPLREKVEGADIQYLPSSREAPFVWSYPGKDFHEFAPLIGNLFSIHGIKRNGALRAAHDIGGYMGKDIDPNDTVMHILIPIE